MLPAHCTLDQDDRTQPNPNQLILTERKEAEIELANKLKELETFKKFAVGRELKMIELKQKIKELQKKVKK